MVKWNEDWLLKKDVNKHIVKDWARKLGCDLFLCILRNKSLENSIQGLQALMQHSDKRDHKAVAKTRLSDTQVHIRTPKPISSISKPSPLLNANIGSQRRHHSYTKLQRKIFFRLCDDLNLLLKKIFPDSGITERLILSKKKASYVIRDGLSPLLAKEICNDV